MLSIIILPLQSAVSFAMPASATIVEGGSAVALCVEMTATSMAATLDKEVVLTLSTVDGTGKCIIEHT